MLGVKIVIMLIVITIVWNILTKALVGSMNAQDKIELLKAKGKMPWWYVLDGYLILIDLLGLIYVAAYFLFVYFK